MVNDKILTKFDIDTLTTLSKSGISVLYDLRAELSCAFYGVIQMFVVQV